MDPRQNVGGELMMFDNHVRLFKMHCGSTGAADQRQKGGYQ